jgi:small conductance mechanosensitive channel
MLMMFERAAKLLSEKLITWLDYFILMLPNILFALTVLIIFYGAAKLLSSGAKKILEKTRLSYYLQTFFSALIYYFVIGFGTFIALEILKLDKIVLSLLAGAGIVGLALSFAFQDLATNLIAGFFLSFQNPFKIGDRIETNGFTGMVERIGIRSVSIVTDDLLHIIIPSKDVFQSPLKNFDRVSQRKIVIKIGISYSENLDRIEKIVLEALSTVGDVMQEEPKEVFFEEFGESSINFTLRCTTEKSEQTHFLFVQSMIIKAVKTAFEREKITIPFPIRTIQIQS